VTTNTLFQRSILRSLGLAAVAGAIGLSVLLTTGASAESTTMHADGPKPTVVLVHGAWADASSWDGVIRRLQDDGYSVITPANPLRRSAPRRRPPGLGGESGRVPQPNRRLGQRRVQARRGGVAS
jgi:pimeloyl-ACP methyl ester carboxylesterase